MAEFSIKSNAIQFMASPSGLIGTDGAIRSNLSIDAPGIRISAPIEIFPFLKPGIDVLITLSVVQIQPEEPAIETAKLILPH